MKVPLVTLEWVVQCLTQCTLLSPSSAPHFSLPESSFFLQEDTGVVQYDRSKLLTAVRHKDERYEVGDMVKYAKADGKLNPNLPLSDPSQSHIGRVIRFVVSDDPSKLNGLCVCFYLLFIQYP